ncbi:MAG: DUF4355 domain-containing protein [Thermoleophilaceae bacterium]|nr:DUF4355 domain-containing protein [Thermoleophilaceae bacterium]
MPHDASTENAAKDTDQAAGGGGSGERTFTQEQVNDLIAREKGQIQSRYADYDDLKTAAARLAELEESKKSDVEKLASERDRLQGEMDRAAAENLRLRVATSKGLPADLVDRLRGSTQEEMEADADQLLELVKPTPSLDGGTRHVAATGDMNTLLRRSAGRT